MMPEVYERKHGYWFSNRGWLTCECGTPLKDWNGRGVHMPEGLSIAAVLHDEHTNRTNGGEHA